MVGGVHLVEGEDMDVEATTAVASGEAMSLVGGNIEVDTEGVQGATRHTE